jgi:glutamyl-tRNA(Gln) amidotransferase subunit E
MHSPLKPFSEMTEQDYADIGLKSGLEIHQQLLTDKKLFCRCPAGRYSHEFDAEILRHMRPTLSELGEYDGTALMEFKTKKDIIYQINHESVCTYEMDDTPPFEINPQALDIALEVAMLLNYKLVSEIHIARKQYLDGSIPTGFQRTTIVGIDGWIPYKNRRIGLFQLGLEEDACREVSDSGHLRVYRTDRLGMPLIETVTRPEMHTPQEVAEVGQIIRRLARSTGKVRTGIGAARQDVNVSITGGVRIEIKGVPRIPLIPLLIYNEALRQYALLQIREELKRRGITTETFQAASSNVTHLLQNTSWQPIAQALKNGEQVHGIMLKGFLGILSHPTQTGKVFSREISDRARVVACLTRLPNILTSESAEETIDSFIWGRIRKALNGNSHDSFILVWGGEQDLKTAVQEIVIRAKEATIGIPSETRQALADGTNGFERILPGPDRMYPDTDLPPMEITSARIERLQKNVPPKLWEREAEYRRLGVPDHLIMTIAASPKAALFEQMTQTYPQISPVQIARCLFEKTKAWKRKGLPAAKLTDEIWEQFFMTADNHPALLEAGDDIFKSYLTDQAPNFDEALKYFSSGNCSEADVSEILNVLLNNALPGFASEQAQQRYLMGAVMQQCRGHIAARRIREIVTDKIAVLNQKFAK